MGAPLIPARRGPARAVPWSLGLVMAMTLAGAGTALASPGRIVSPADGPVLLPGQVVEVRWEALPADVDELELLLEVDQANAVRLRLTPQLAGATSGYAWRVPNLPGERARLRLRVGRDGREVECEPSAPFTIRADQGAPFPGIRWHGNERWLDETLACGWTPPPSVGSQLAEGGEWCHLGVALWAGEGEAGVPPPQSSADRPHLDGPRRDSEKRGSFAPDRRPLDTPLRP